jgi:hypothetical protein
MVGQQEPALQLKVKALDQLEAQAAGLRRVAELEQMGGVEAGGHQDLQAAAACDTQRPGSAQVLSVVVLGQVHSGVEPPHSSAQTVPSVAARESCASGW